MAQDIANLSQGLNTVMVIGQLGRSPEMRYTPSGKPVASFSIVSTYPVTTSNGTQHEETDWFNVIVWGTLAETCKEQLHVGQRVFIEGRMKTRRWTDAENVSYSCAEVIASRLISLDREQNARATDVGQAPFQQSASLPI